MSRTMTSYKVHEYTVKLLIVRPVGQGPCDQHHESCLDWENSFGLKKPVIPNPPPTKVDKDHAQHFNTVTLQP